MRTLARLSFIFVLMSAMPSFATNCNGMYTYTDAYPDENGNVVAVNYTQVDGACGSTTSYADLTLTWPNDYSDYQYDSGVSDAEAIAVAPAIGLEESGYAAGFNEIAMSCGSSFDLFPDITIQGAGTTVRWTGGRVGNVCSTANNCAGNVIPMCSVLAVTVLGGAPCSPGWFVENIAVRINSGPVICFGTFAAPLANANPGVCKAAN
jgi:hypothetical protein